jgi:hypothetical protein
MQFPLTSSSSQKPSTDKNKTLALSRERELDQTSYMSYAQYAVILK